MNVMNRIPRLSSTSVRLFAGIACAAAILVGPGQIDRVRAEEPVRGGFLTLALQSPAPILVSAFHTGGFIGVVSTKMLEGLLSYGFDLKPRPELAESWDVSADGKTITFNLRKGVKWHDGAPFTSADVKFSLMNVWKKLHWRGRSTFARVTSVDTPDDHTVVVNLSEPTPALMKALNGYESQVLPRHIYEGTDIVTNPKNLAPVGTGPFMFDKWKKGDFLKLVKNPNYWNKGLPYLDGMIIRDIPDAAARAASLEAGDTLIATFSPVPLSDVARLEAMPHLAIETRGYELLSPVFLLDLNKRGPYLSNVKVRRALAHAINRDFIVNTVWSGFGKAATGPIPSAHSDYYTTDVPKYPFNPAKANQLLDEAGFPRKGDGVRFKLTIDYSVFGDEYPRTAEYLKQALKAVGIDLTLRSQDIGNLLKRVFTDYDYDIHMNYWYAGIDPTIGVQRLYWCDNIKKGVPFANANGYCNPEMDKIIVATQIEHNDQKRKALFVDMQKIAQRDLPVLDLFEVKFFTIFNAKVKNHTIGLDGPYGSFANVWIAKD